MDEALCAVGLKVLSERRPVRLPLQHKPRGLEIVLTGHQVSDRMKEIADYATEMHKIKHPYDLGKLAREGIEF